MRTRRFWKITGPCGTNMGTYEARSEAEALDEMARDAGYEDQEDACANVGEWQGFVREVLWTVSDGIEERELSAPTAFDAAEAYMLASCYSDAESVSLSVYGDGDGEQTHFLARRAATDCGWAVTHGSARHTA